MYEFLKNLYMDWSIEIKTRWNWSL